MTDIDERPPGPPLDQHMSFLLSSDDRVPLLGMAARAAKENGRDPQESTFIRSAVRIGTRHMLDALTKAEREDIDARGRELLAELDARKEEAQRRAAARRVPA